MGEVFVFANQKGGVGKTTSTFNIGVALADIGQRVLLVDLDPQAGLTFYAGINPDDLSLTVYNCLIRNTAPEEAIVTTDFNVQILPANIDLSLAEFRLINEYARERRMARIINEVRDQYDFILIDSQPSLGLLTINALAAADQVIIPIACEYLSIRGTAALLKLIAKIRGQMNSKLTIAGLLPTMYDNRTRHAREVLNELTKQFSDLYVFPFTVNRSIRFAESAAERKPIFDTKVQVPGALAYREVARQLVKERQAIS